MKKVSSSSSGSLPPSIISTASFLSVLTDCDSAEGGLLGSGMLKVADAEVRSRL
jgi:hypothetical protein